MEPAPAAGPLVDLAGVTFRFGSGTGLADLDRLTGRDNLRYAAELFGLGRDAPIGDAAARFGIDRSLDLRVGGYSTGTKTRPALARAASPATPRPSSGSGSTRSPST